MQKPLQEYIRGLYGGYTSEATRKVGGGGMDFSNVPISANPLDLALRLSKMDTMLPKPLSALPEYLNPMALDAIRSVLNVPFMGGGLGADIKEPSSADSMLNKLPISLSAEDIATIGQKEQLDLVPFEKSGSDKTTAEKPTVMSSTTRQNIRRLWTELHSFGLSIPDPKRRHAFIANEIERMRMDGEVDDNTASTLHRWNDSVNVVEEPKKMDERLFWILLLTTILGR